MAASGSHVLEEGDLYLLYRPRVQQEEVERQEQIQRLLMVLKPWSGDDRLRMLIIGRKRLPEIGEHERFWGFVDAVGSPRQLRDALERRTYETGTRGERLQPEARPAGEGVYVIARHDGHTHLAYELELPERRGDPQEALNVQPEASYILSVKNPEQPAPPGAGLGSRAQADFPAQLQERFGGRRFIALAPPAFLDHEGAEILLIGAATDASEELGLDLDAEAEQSSWASVYHDLPLRRERHTALPLYQGRWA